MKLYYVYILASPSRRVLYVGITSSFEQRLWDHRTKRYPDSFTSRYNVTRLVYFEEYTRVVDAIAREKQLKSWNRAKKLRLIDSINPEWDELAPLGGELGPMSYRA